MTRLFGVRRRVWGGVAVLVMLAACSPASLVDVAPPSTVVDPAAATTSAGASQLYAFAVSDFARIVGGGGALFIGSPTANSIIELTGQFTDELMTAGNSGSGDFFDARIASIKFSPTATDVFSGSFYSWLHQPRTEAGQAREALQRYAPNTPKAWQGQLYAQEGYTLVYFAELFCSGIPLTTVSLAGIPQTTGGFTTQELLERAMTLFDSAITVAVDTARFVNLAKVGKGRALLGLGRFADAAAVVQSVPTDFSYRAIYNSAGTLRNEIGNNPKAFQVIDNEGGTSLVWTTDPRTATTTLPTTGAQKVTAKYSVTAAGTLDPTTSNPNTPVRVADGLEARLIEAEADLAAGGSNWLTILNTLRVTCVGGALCAPLPVSANMPFPLAAGSLPPLADPGTATGRLDLLMRERAMWLYLTGHRQGDLRRLVHTYHRDPAVLWPSGLYQNAGFPPSVAADNFNGSTYGTDVVFSPSLAEALNNPLYRGCVNMDP